MTTELSLKESPHFRSQELEERRREHGVGDIRVFQVVVGRGDHLQQGCQQLAVLQERRITNVNFS